MIPNIKFEEQKTSIHNTGVTANKKNLMQWLLDKKIAKNEEQATYILLGIIIICIVAIMFIFLTKSLKNNIPDNIIPTNEPSTEVI